MCLYCSNSSFQQKTVVVVYGFQLSPSTPPIEVLRQQLVALQDDDMTTVYRYASPNNKLQVGGSLERFQTMIKSPNSPYRPLVNHIDAQILMESNMMESKQFLVRIINTNNNKNKNKKNNNKKKGDTKNDGDDNEEDENDDAGDDDSLLSLSSGSRGDDDDDDGLEQTYDYWWSMSKCQGGEFDGSFMVDAVFPNFGWWVDKVAMMLIMKKQNERTTTFFPTKK